MFVLKLQVHTVSKLQDTIRSVDALIAQAILSVATQAAMECTIAYLTFMLWVLIVHRIKMSPFQTSIRSSTGYSGATQTKGGVGS
jgi:hypothetical protein